MASGGTEGVRAERQGGGARARRASSEPSHQLPRTKGTRDRDEGCGTADFQNPVTRGYDAMEDDFAT